MSRLETVTHVWAYVREHKTRRCPRTELICYIASVTLTSQRRPIS